MEVSDSIKEIVTPHQMFVRLALTVYVVAQAASSLSNQRASLSSSMATDVSVDGKITPSDQAQY